MLDSGSCDHLAWLCFVVPNCNYINPPLGSKISNQFSSLHCLPLSVWRARKKNDGKQGLLLGCLLVVHFLKLSGREPWKTMKQIEALDILQKAKLHGNSGIDTNLFEVNEVENGAETESHKIHPQEGLKEKDRIDMLPGQPHVGFSQYGGYVTIDESKGKALYYYFAEAPLSKKSLPLLLWLNGGPGCSSLAYGAMQELGPFRVHSEGKTLYRNQYAWNKVANVLFLESPAGVGFSYSNTTSDYRNGGDRKTAKDNYAFLVNWLERFPEYKKRDFYISGESYAGHYVPQLAHTILHHNKKADGPIINLKGIIIGNAVINDETDELGMYQYFGSHALVSEKTIRQMEKHCNFSPEPPARARNVQKLLMKLMITLTLSISTTFTPIMFQHQSHSQAQEVTPEFDPCSDYYVYAYLNRADVQKALHANVTKLKYDWELAVTLSKIGQIALHHHSPSARVHGKCGDTDGRVPVTSTMASIDTMKLSVKTPWHPWFVAGEVGGYTEVYKGDLTFATVRGAGHQVPSFRPRELFHSFLTSFLALLFPGVHQNTDGLLQYFSTKPRLGMKFPIQLEPAQGLPGSGKGGPSPGSSCPSSVA
ncbi:Serine carboxypeptidase-like 40 [Vitis vinifera]|uniref:Carboxypeptidase n=1 Tax=Vitis vinifera TaxID=29760 RepID=A0A438IUV4_VITVI|nr:Serine carboxypeptidase-like 40 [Vitis vinifera]